MNILIYPGGLRPDRRAPGDFAEEGAFQNIFLLRFIYVFWYFWIRFFVCFWRRFRQGGDPQILFSSIFKWFLDAFSLAVAKCVFSSIFKWFWTPFRDPWGTQVLTFSTLIFVVVSGTVQDGLKTRFYRFRLHFKRRFATFSEPLGK